MIKLPLQLAALGLLLAGIVVWRFGTKPRFVETHSDARPRPHPLGPFAAPSEQCTASPEYDIKGFGHA